MDCSLSARIKIVYLLVLSSGLFFTSNLTLIGGLAFFQLALYLSAGLAVRNLLQAYKRVFLLALVVTLSYLLIPGSPDAVATTVMLINQPVQIYWGEWPTIVIMITRVLTLITASLWVRDSQPPGDFVASLRWLKVPETVSVAVDAGLQLSQKRGDGSGGGHKQHGKKKKGGKNKVAITFKQIRSGELHFFDELIARAYRKVNGFLQQQYAGIDGTKRHDITIILTIVTAVLSLKLLQLLPGLPIAPGHKNLVVVPLIVIATLSTHARFGGFSAGLAIGIASFLLGYGKFGVLEIAHFALPGLVSDLLARPLLAGTPRWLVLRFAVLGAIIGLTRFAANFLIIMLAGAPLLAWAAFMPMLISQTMFGALSAPVGAYIVIKIKNGQLFKETEPEQSRSEQESK